MLRWSWLKILLLILVFSLGFCLGVTRLLISLPDNSDFDRLVGQKIAFTGRIVAEPSVREKSTIWENVLWGILGRFSRTRSKTTMVS